METFKFYLEMGLKHVLDLNGYDHMLFLAALALPFALKKVKQAVYLASVFTLTHCLSLTLSVYGIAEVYAPLIEFLIPLSILMLLGLNIKNALKNTGPKTGFIAYTATAIFGLVHGFGFSNYFKMLVAGQEEKLTALVGFASGIELAQLAVLLSVILSSAFLIAIFKIQRARWVLVFSSALAVMTLPLVYKSFTALISAL
jgi:hypothetical protein